MKKNKNKNINSLKNFKRILFSHQFSYVESFTRLKNNYDLNEIDYLYKELLGLKLFNKFLLGQPLPANYVDLRKAPYIFFSDNLMKELSWCFFAIKYYKNEINNFLILQNKFESFLLKGEYKNAESTLDEIEKTICVSIWSIENRFILAEQSGGIEKNKLILNSINNTENDRVFSILADFLSFKSELNTSMAKYHYNLNKYLDKIQDNKVADYFRFKLAFYNGNFSNYSSILYLESTSSIIDRYLTFVRIIQLVGTNNEINHEDIDKINKIVIWLSREINDYNLVNIQFLFNPSKDIAKCKNDLSDSIIQILDKYTSGDYAFCIENSINKILENPGCFDLYEIYIKSIINNNVSYKQTNDNIIFNVLRCMFDIYLKNQNYKESYMELLKITRIIGSSNWNIKLLNFIYNNENSIFPILSNLSLINSNFINPKLCLVFSKENSVVYLNNLEPFYNNSDTIKFWLSYMHNELPNNKLLPYNRRLFYEAKYHENNENISEAIKIYLNIIKTRESNISSRYLYNLTVHRLYNCYIINNDINEAVLIFVNYFLEYNLDYNSGFNLKTLVESINNDPNIYNKDVSVPILFYLYNPKDLHQIYASYDNYLSLNCIERPTELREMVGNYEKDKLIYFLKNICTQDVLEFSYHFSGTDDLEHERILICQWLIELDEKNKNLYSNEISIITQKSIIRKFMKQIDVSKIYVDIKGIKKSVSEIIKETFERYVKISSFIQPMLKVIDVDDNQVRTIDYDNYTKLSNDPKFVYFKELFIELRDHFISSDIFGLDSFLSVRIRNGTLLGQLRKEFVVSNLVTQKKDKDGNYSDNDYWLEKLIFENNRNKFIQIMNSFSQDIDDVIEMIVKKWMQIKTETKNSEGLFDYSLGMGKIISYYDILKDIKDYDSFINYIIKIFINITENNLDNIRNNIIDNIKKMLLDNLNILDKDLSAMKLQECDGKKELFKNIVSSRTNIQTELDKISTWFNITESTEEIDFNFKLLIDVSDLPPLLGPV